MEDNHAATISLLLTGNIPCPPALIQEKERSADAGFSYSDCFRSLKPMIEKADLTIGALDASWEYPDEFIEALKSTGFGMLTMGYSTKENDNREALCRALGAKQLRHHHQDWRCPDRYHRLHLPSSVPGYEGRGTGSEKG